MKKLIRNSALSFVFIILGALFAYFWRRYLVLHLAVADYGLLFSIIAFFSLLMLFVDLGVEPSAAKAIVELRLAKKYDTIRSLLFSVLSIQFFLSVLVFFIVFFSASWLAENYFHIPSATHYIQLLGLWFLTIPLSTFLSYTLLGFEKTTWYTALDFFRMFFLLVIGMILFFFNYDIYAAILAYATINIVLFCLYLPYIFSFFPRLFQHQFTLNTKRLWMIFSYGFIMAFTAFGWLLITQTDTLVLTYLTSMDAVGLYNVALPISLFLLFFTRPVTIVYYPHITALAAEKKFSELAESISLAYKYLFILLLPVALCFMLFSKEIISMLFSTDFVAAGLALAILSFGTLFYGFAMFNNVVFNGLGKAKHMAFITIIVAACNLVLNFILIPYIGIYGAALSTTVSYLLLFSLSCIILMKFVSFVFPAYRWLLIIISGGFASIAVFVLKKLLFLNNLFEAFLCFLFFVFVYILGLFILHVFSIKEIKEFVSHLKKD